MYGIFINMRLVDALQFKWDHSILFLIACRHDRIWKSKHLTYYGLYFVQMFFVLIVNGCSIANVSNFVELFDFDIGEVDGDIDGCLE